MANRITLGINTSTGSQGPITESDTLLDIASLARSTSGTVSLFEDANTTTITIGGGTNQTTVTIGKASQNTSILGTLTAASTIIGAASTAAAPGFRMTGYQTGMFTPTGGASVGLSVGGSAVVTCTASEVTCAQPILAPFGSVGAPGFAFSSASTSGLFYDTGVKIAALGSEIAHFAPAAITVAQPIIAANNTGIVIGKVGTGSGQGSALQAASFTTTERGYITSPQNGMVVYNETANELQAYINSSWTDLLSASVSLQDVLGVGNTTGGTDIVVSSGDILTAPEGIGLTVQTADSTGATACGTLTLAGGAGNASGGDPGDVAINGGAAAASGDEGGRIVLTAGAGNGAGAGGLIQLLGADGGSTGNGGQVFIEAGDGGATSGGGGNCTLKGGAAFTGDGGTASLTGGNALTSGAGGSVGIGAGNASGTNKAGGSVSISAGDSTTSTTGGAVTVTAGTSVSNGAGGAITITSGSGGSANGNGGAASLTGGASPNGVSGGAASLTGGAATVGTGGAVTINAGAGATNDGSISIGTTNALALNLGAGASHWQINSSGHFLAGSDDSYDIGASGATRPRRVYVGTEVVVGSTITLSGTSIKASNNTGVVIGEVGAGSGQGSALQLASFTTTERGYISSPVNGMLVYDETLNKMMGYINSSWTDMTGAGATPNLATVLSAGNTTGGTDISVSSGDEILVDGRPILHVLGSATGINAKSDTLTGIVTVPSGKTAIITGVVVYCTAASSITVPAEAAVGTVSGGYVDVFTNTPLAGLTTSGDVYKFASEGGAYGVVGASTTAYLYLRTFATGTSQTLSAYVLGFLV